MRKRNTWSDFLKGKRIREPVILCGHLFTSNVLPSHWTMPSEEDGEKIMATESPCPGPDGAQDTARASDFDLIITRVNMNHRRDNAIKDRYQDF